MYEERSYRNAKNSKRFEYFQAMVDESDLWIGTTMPQDQEMKDNIHRMIKQLRSEIETYGKTHPSFFSSLVPIAFAIGAPETVIEMCEAGQYAGVGPMASVAGLIAERIGRYIENLFPNQEIIIENGGDIWAKFHTPLTIRMDAGNSPFSRKVGISVSNTLSPCGICTSSGTVGHSLSFGKADALTVISSKAAIADARATSICNKIQSTEDLHLVSDIFRTEDQILGCVAVINDQIIAVGDISLVSFV